MAADKSVRRVALLTAGGLAPCLSSAVGGLIERYSEVAPDVEIIAYLNGYHGLLSGRHLDVTPEVRAKAGLLHKFGGSPIGNSRVKLTNTADLIKRGLIADGQNALQVAAERLVADGVDVLHTIGGDDTNTTAADLAAYLQEHDYDLTVVGLPKTIDNDVIPIKQSLGAWTAAEQGAIFAKNVIAEHSSNPRMLVVHEVMGRNCGWLTAATAAEYRKWVAAQEWNPGIGLAAGGWDVHAVYVPEATIDLDAEAERLKAVMDENDCVTIFLSEGAGVPSIVAELEARGEDVPRDPFGHVKLDAVNPGAWFAKQFAERIGGRQRRRPRADQAVHRLRGRRGAARRERGRRARRGARRRAARDRVPPDRRRQGVRPVRAVVRGPADGHRPGLIRHVRRTRGTCPRVLRT
jgi:pyrophosphate--fructose-6-phosphate 1-phosphotransferase